MSDFIDLIEETFAGNPGLRPGLDEVALEERVGALDERMRTVGHLTWLSVPLMFAIALIMVLLLVTADAGTDIKWLVLYGAVFVWAMLVIAMVKLWHFQMQSDIAMRKEILRTQAMILED